MSNKYNLSEGSLKFTMRGEGEYPTPTLQVLGSKKITSGQANKERYRLLLSDGKNTVSSAMVTKDTDDDRFLTCLEMFAVIRVNTYMTSLLNNTTRVLLIMDMELLFPGKEVGDKIGNPIALSALEESTSSKNANSIPKENGSAKKIKIESTNGPVAVNRSVPSLSNQITFPISSLSPYHNKWVIKARVTNKSPVRVWSNSKGEGKLFSIDLVDEQGEIRLTGFKDAVDKFYDHIQVDKVYYISKCQVKPANKQYSSLNNDYEMTMTPETIIQECQEEDVSEIPQIKYNFVTIDKIANAEINSLIDVIGVAKSTSDLQTFQSKSTGRELRKKEVVLVDQSTTAVTLTLWGSEAESFDGTDHPVVVMKGARITEFGGGKNLSTVSGTTFKINPEMTECYRIRGWYDTEGKNVDVTNISARSGVGSFNTPWLIFREVQDQNLGNAERGDYYQFMGTVLLMRSENAMYKACPTEECNKKVIDMENGMYRCEKCNREFPNFKYRLLASMNVGDWSGNQWISMFSTEVEKILGMTAAEVGQQVEENPEALAAIVDKANFKQFIMKCRAKMEMYNDESRLKTVCIKVDPINYEEYNAHLIEKIQQLIA